jgi:HEAT repeat protein
MIRNTGWLCACVLLTAAPVLAADLPREEVRLRPARWRASRQVLQMSAEQAGFRWTMPATLSRRAFVGPADGKAVSADELLRDLAKQTALTVEVRHGVVLLHLPNEGRRKELSALLERGERRARLTALSELGWSGDADAFPILARLAVGDDVELALAAAQALRRLDGEKALDWRLHGVSAEDPEFYPMTEAAPPWQTPLGSVFPNCVPEAAVLRSASSPYLPLREAAARLTPTLGPKGKTLCAKLADDRSPLVAAAAQRTLPAWAEPDRTAKRPQRRSDGKPWWDEPPIDLTVAAGILAEAKEHDTVWRLQGRRVAYQSSPEAIRVMLDYGRSGKRWSHMVSRPLAEFCGGPEVLAWLKATSSKQEEYYDHQQGWALWGLSALQDGEELARSLRPALEGRAFWAAPPEYTATAAGRHALPGLLGRIETRGHWVCRALGHVGGPEATETLIARLDHKDPGTAVAAAKGLGDTASLAGVAPLIAQLKHEDRLRRHWAVLGLSRIGGPDAAAALTELLAVEEKRRDRLVRRAAAEVLREIGPLSAEARRLIDRFEEEDRNLVPEYRPRNPRLGEDFPLNTEVAIKEFKAGTYCSVGETRAALDWGNRLLFRYGGCTPCYSNEFFAFDVGTGTWFPIRAADQYCDLFNEVRPNPGCSRGMTYDGLHKLVWIGQGIGGSTGPTSVSHNRSTGLAAYDAALDRFITCTNSPVLATAYSGEPAKALTFDYDAGLVVSSKSGGEGIGLVDAATHKTFLSKGPDRMPSWDQYRPPAFVYDPVSQKVLCTHPDLNWKLLIYDRKTNAYRLTETPPPGMPNKQIMGGLVYDSLNREIILIGGSRKESGVMPTCRYDRMKDRWIDLEVKELGKMGVGQGTCVYDPEHNVILEPISGAAYRYRNVPIGTRAFYGGGVGKIEP